MAMLGNTLECNYALLIQEQPDNPKIGLPLRLIVFKALLTFWKKLIAMHRLVLEEPKTLWNIRLSIACLLAQEEYGIISLFAHLLKILKYSQKSEEAKAEFSKDVPFTTSLLKEFSEQYAESTKFINTLSTMPEVKEQKKEIAVLPSGLAAYFPVFHPDYFIKDLREIIPLIKTQQALFGLQIPRSYKPITAVTLTSTATHHPEPIKAAIPPIPVPQMKQPDISPIKPPLVPQLNRFEEEKKVMSGDQRVQKPPSYEMPEVKTSIDPKFKSTSKTAEKYKSGGDSRSQQNTMGRKEQAIVLQDDQESKAVSLKEIPTHNPQPVGPSKPPLPFHPKSESKKEK